ncbi:multidrug effflux MFS transporter [Aestuariivirga sp.]|uniref:multidrug effflux MFS transporter n=1 Tax=Aestuariivirga sp. TaxID=2650926 RepID=UPI0039E68E92
MTDVQKPNLQFIIIVALLTAMVAMSIDTMLPALGIIAHELGAAHENDRQLVITLFFAGMTLGTLVSGPVSDSTGRKPAIIGSLCFYLVGAAMCAFSGSFTMLLVGRFIQGFGAAGPRIVAIAMVRDGYKGAAMAQVMSFVMSVFMLVPIIAPSVGQLVLFAGSWRLIFLGFIGMASIAGLLLYFRQPETLKREYRQPFALATIAQAAVAVVTNPVALGYTLAGGCIFGGFIAYVGTSQQIFAEQYNQGDWFALWFGAFALALALAMMLNARLVVRYGMRKLSKWALRAEIILSAIFFVLSLIYHGHPPLITLGVYLFCNFFCCGILFGNYNAIAMEPMGRIAGMASAISGALSTLLALVSGSLIGRLYDGTVMSLVGGYLGLGILAFLCTEWAERRRRKA